MEYSVLSVARITGFLNRLIQDGGERACAGFVFSRLMLVAWIMASPCIRSTRDFLAVTLRLARPRPEPETDPPFLRGDSGQ